MKLFTKSIVGMIAAGATAAMAIAVFVSDANAATRRHPHRYARLHHVIHPHAFDSAPNAPTPQDASRFGVLLGLVDTGINGAADAYPGYSQPLPGYGLYGRGYHGPGFGSPAY
jgi:hypothetical protein